MNKQNEQRAQDERYMTAAIRLARSRLGLTGENPAVGALIVQQDVAGGRIVGRGVTASGGRPHAEPQALSEAGALAQGATAYVTLEPCCHIGKTPPCVDALIAAGIVRVVIALTDPDARVAGGGVARLKAAGIAVTIGVCQQQAAHGLSAYLSRKIAKRPEVTLKLALSRDGKIGDKRRCNVVISGEVSRAQSHLMRAQHDAILVGISTAIIDDPRLDCRLNGLVQRSPRRIVLDSHLALSLDSQLVRTALTVPLLVVGAEGADETQAAQLRECGVEVVLLPAMGYGICLTELLCLLANEGINSLLIEGGRKIAASFWHAGLVDRLGLFESPVIIGDEGYAGPSLTGRDDHYTCVKQLHFGNDLYREWRKKSSCLPASSPILAPSTASPV